MTRHSQDMDHWVGRRVAHLRQAMGLSQAALADQLGVSFQQVQKYEKGTNRISASRLFQLTEIFGCTASDLFPAPSGGNPSVTAPDPVLMTKDALALITAYGAITDQNLRRALSQIAVALAKA